MFVKNVSVQKRIVLSHPGYIISHLWDIAGYFLQRIGCHSRKKIELDVKESFLVFKIYYLSFFLTFNIHIIDFLLLGFYPLKMTSCTCLHQNLLCDTLTVTRNVNFTLSLFIEISSISFIRNYFKKNALSLSVNVFSTKVLTGDTIFTSPTGEETAILRGHPSHAKV